MGENDKNSVNPYVLNFILNSDCARGVLLGAISKRFDTIVEFTAFEDFISFEKKGKNKTKRIENHKIKVTIEVDMVCGVII